MSRWLFVAFYVFYIVALIVGYRLLIKYIEKKKLQKKFLQEQKLMEDIRSNSKNV